MKVAVMGSRNLNIINLGQYLPPDTTELVSGGSQGVDEIAKVYAKTHGLKFTEFLPDYMRYKRDALRLRNMAVIAYADYALIFWDGQSRGTQAMLHHFKIGKIKTQLITLK